MTGSSTSGTPAGPSSGEFPIAQRPLLSRIGRTALTTCAPISTPPSPAGRRRGCCGSTSATRCSSSTNRLRSARLRSWVRPRRLRRSSWPARRWPARLGCARTAGRAGRMGGQRAVEPRRGGVRFDDVSAQLVACALALLNWHDRARFSPVDGSPTCPVKAGWSRRNILTGDEGVSPRRPGRDLPGARRGDRAVPACQTVWPPRLFSLLAGLSRPASPSRPAWRARSTKRSG